ncbi:MAG: UDP-glucose--hexose-1-phosphate uridylyltransferase [Rhodothermaceae bacterium]
MSEKLQLTDHPHRRLNILTGEWVLVSPHRAKRPWQGKTEEKSVEKKPSYDPGCYLCPGNERAGGKVNPEYKEPFAFTNDFSALNFEGKDKEVNISNLLVAKEEKGICRVICFSPDHSLTLPDMEIEDIVKVVELWQREYEELGSNEEINYVQIFENKGAIMGCSNPHPHGQIWAQKSIPNEPRKELIQQQKYYEENCSCMLCDYLKQELEEKERIVYENDHFVALVPFWAIWPFETMVLSKRHLKNLSEFTSEEKAAFAEIIKVVTAKYDNMFEINFPYSAGIHQSPTDNTDHPEWHFHMHFYPPLLRSAEVKKFMVGYEMLGEAQRDITPETSAERLRNLSKKRFNK